MPFEHIASLPGSPEPTDIFEPHMPSVDLLSDMEGFFVQVRELLESENTSAYIQKAGLPVFVPSNQANEAAAKGQRHVAVITPGRMISLVPAPRPRSLSEKQLAPVKSILPSQVPLQISAISYTKLEAYVQDTSKTKCIPFLGFLLAFAYLGHSVIVFEGHPSALEFGVKNSHVLFMDSGMLPFLAENWAEVVFRAMKPDPKIFIHERKNFRLSPVVKKSSPPGWQRSEPDGEQSYVNILLTTLGKANYKQSVHIVAGQPAPSPREFTTNPDELEYISTLPFKYDRLNTAFITKFLWDMGKPQNPSATSTKIFKAKLIESGGTSREVAFELKLSKPLFGKQQLEIRLL